LKNERNLGNGEKKQFLVDAQQVSGINLTGFCNFVTELRSINLSGFIEDRIFEQIFFLLTD
jgi:hypothetical protein